MSHPDEPIQDAGTQEQAEHLKQEEANHVTENGMTDNIYRRLNAARTAFHALQLKKSGHNKFAGYYYFELGDFLIPALKVFSEHGITAIVSFGVDTAYMNIVNTDNPDDRIVIVSPMGSAALKGCHEVQNIGAVETYQRRYLWVAALEIVEHDALDSSEPIKEKPASAKSITQDVLSKMPPDEVEFLQEIAADTVALLEEGRNTEAQAFITKKNLDAEEKIALWAMFNSKQRSALKAKPTAEEFANTP